MTFKPALREGGARPTVVIRARERDACPPAHEIFVSRIHSGTTIDLDHAGPTHARLLLRRDHPFAEMKIERMIVIGRAPQNDLIVADPAVSHRHCVIVPIDGHVRLVDCSNRGVLVDGRLVYHAALKPGMVLTVGSSSLRVVGEGVPYVPTAQREMIGHSAPMRALRREIEIFGPTDRPVLLQGETGTGKELAARALHAASARRDRAFVAVNCANLTEQLADDALFGHERGAFTSAERTHRGYFDEADGGTLFLDEIGELPPVVQAIGRCLRASDQWADVMGEVPSVREDGV